MNAAVLLLLPVLAVDVPPGHVRLSLEAYQQLKAAADAQPADDGDDEDVSEPASPRVLEARVTGLLTRKALQLELNVVVDGTPGRWHVLPLVPTGVAVTDVTITGGGTLMQLDDMRALVFPGAGRRTVSLKLNATGGEQGASRSVEMALLPGISRQFSLEVQGRLDAEVTPEALLSTDRTGGRRVVRGFLPPTEASVGIRWSTDAVAEEMPKPERLVRPTSKEPPRINVQTSMLASVGERLLTTYATLRYAIFHAPVSRFEWTVPDGAEVIGAQGRGVSEWSCNAESGERTCSVELPFPVQRTYELSIQLEQALPKDLTQVDVALPQAKGVQRQSGHVAVEVMGNAEVTPGEATTATREDVRELPTDLFAGQSTPILLAFKFLEAPTRVALEVRRRDSVETSPISVDDASFTTVWTTEGRTITEGTFHVRNRQRQFLALQLPPQAVIQSAFVADAPVKPSTGEDGRIRVPLRSHGRSSDSEDFVVQVVYVLDGLGLPALGRMHAVLPAMDSEVGAMHHTLVLPDRQRLWAFDGDMSIETPRVIQDVGAPRHSSRGLLLGGAMDNGGFAANAPAAPAPQMEDQMDEEQDAKQMQEQRANAAPQRMARVARRGRRGGMGAALGAMVAEEPVSISSPVGNTGVLPVRIQIPRSGDRYTAHAFYVPPNTALKWSARVGSRSTVDGLAWLVFALTALLGFGAVARSKQIFVRGPLTAAQMASAAAVVVLLLAAVVMRSNVQMAPGFAVLGALVGWTWRQVRKRMQTAAPPAQSAHAEG